MKHTQLGRILFTAWLAVHSAPSSAWPVLNEEDMDLHPLEPVGIQTLVYHPYPKDQLCEQYKNAIVKALSMAIKSENEQESAFLYEKAIYLKIDANNYGCPKSPDY